MALTLNNEAVTKARSMIADGKIDHGPWDGQTAPRSSATCLGHDESEAGKDGEWKYPIIRGGHVNAKGVSSAAGYAETEGASAIASVARRLSDEIHMKSHAAVYASATVAPAKLVLDASHLPAGKAIPLALAGHPAEIGGQPVHYFKKELARVGDWTHRGEKNDDGSPVQFSITPGRIDGWVSSFHKRMTNGVKPFVPDKHVAKFSAKDNQGYVIDVAREGDSLFGTLQLIGDDAAKLAAKNDVSIYVTANSLDANGNQYEEALEHVALTPNPALPLQPFVKIAASADGPAVDVPVYVPPSAKPPTRRILMTPELASQFRAKFGIAANVPDDQLPDVAAQKALALSADVTTITGERDAAKSEAEAKGRKVLELSAGQSEPDSLSLSLITKAFKNERDQVIAAGVISEAGMQEIDKLFLPGGKPSRIALSLSADSMDPLYSRVCDIIRKFPGTAVQNKAPRGAIAAEPLRLSADDPAQPDKPDLAKVNDYRSMVNLPPLKSLDAA